MPKRWKVRRILGKPKYQTVFLAYLDILGFRNLVKSYGQRSPAKLVKLFDQIDEVVQTPVETGLHRRYLGDSVLIWTQSSASLHYMLQICRTLQCLLLEQGCLVRGAIVRGKHYSQHFAEWDLKKNAKYLTQHEIMVSPALVKAVTKEQSIELPTILVEGAICKIHNRDIVRFLKAKKQKLSSRRYYPLPNGYFERFVYLNLIATKPSAASQLPRGDIQGERFQLARLRKIIAVNLKTKDKKVFKKWKHIRMIFNTHIRYYQKALKAASLPTVEEL